MAAAVVWGGLKCDCAKCPDDQVVRARRGCEGPTSKPIRRLTCPGCWGRGCAACEDRGWFGLYRCPLKVVPRECWEVCESVPQVEVGILPATGGFYDQAATWVKAMRLVRRKKAEYDEERYGGKE